MAYQRSQMLYDDGKYYKWTARADHDNPLFTHGKDRLELDKTEGYEVLNFINQFAKNVIWNGGKPGLDEYRKIEKMIRYSVPSSIRSHAGKRDWIVKNWNKVA